jgi:nucleolar protein 56
MDFSQQRSKLLDETKKAVSEAVSPDIVISQTLHSIDELASCANTLAKRLRDWHGYFLPELERAISDHEVYARLIVEKSYAELTSTYVVGQPMGAELSSTDEVAVSSLARQVLELFRLRQSFIHYLEAVMSSYCKNFSTLAGTTIAARLLSGAGSLRRLAMLPSSTIQLLGAEKALFRHIKTGGKSPKHGFIISHQLLAQTPASQRGKVARSLADKLSLCAKLDFFSGEFKADVYKADLERKFLKK